MTPREVVDRFTENELVHMVAYQNLYGPLGGERLDYLFARLGADTVSPHMKRGHTPKIEDHLALWGRGKQQQTPEEMLAVARGIQRAYDQKDERNLAIRSRRAAQPRH